MYPIQNYRIRFAAVHSNPDRASRAIRHRWLDVYGGAKEEAGNEDQDVQGVDEESE